MRDLNPQPLTGQAVLHHLFLVHNLVESSAHAVDYPMWSIGLEWQLYLLFPLLVWMIWHWDIKVTFFIVLLIAVLARGVFKLAPGDLSFALASGPFPYCYIMLMGIYAAHLTANRCNVPNWILWGGFLVSASLIVLRLGGAFGETFACGSATLCILLLAINEEGFVHRLLSARWLAKVGLFSYSIYLMHAPILHAMRYGLDQFELSVEARFLIFMLVAMPAMLVISYGFFLIFEKPFIGKMRKVAKVLPTNAVAATTVR
jgi:peptidoglycan/LPS O-acetylase OafA/YrhL